MKRVLVASIIIFLAGFISAHATTNTFRVVVSGVIKGTDGSSIKVTSEGLLTTSANELAVVVDTDNNYWELDEVNPGSSNSVVRMITGVNSMSLQSKGTFISDLHVGRGATFGSGIPPIGGDIFASGKFLRNGAKPSFRANLVGVWKDPTYSPKSAAAYSIKGAIKSTEAITTPPNY